MRRGLQTLLAVVGTVAVLAGLYAVVLGAGQVLGPDRYSDNIDSEIRFFAAWYVVAGVALLRTLPQIEREGRTILFVAAGFFLAACGRAISLAVVGPPSPFYIALMAIEFLLPVVVIPWQRHVSQTTESSDSR
jgi:hypothetical protein